MNFDELLDFVKAEEEMGYLELFEEDGFIAFKNFEGKKLVDINFFASEDTFESIKECLKSNGVNLSERYIPETNSHELRVEAEIVCGFLLSSDNDDTNYLSKDKDLGRLNFEDGWAHVQINRVKGKRILEIAFYANEKEYEMFTSELELYNFPYSEKYVAEMPWYELWVEALGNLIFIHSNNSVEG
jgi:hypothetical protein